jgi:hypothetical protein
VEVHRTGIVDRKEYGHASLAGKTDGIVPLVANSQLMNFFSIIILGPEYREHMNYDM